ncbi:MAG TPA: GYD family protein, partial [Streptomyces sp.]|nr:GYD family protein [Streptomyces sp.]
MPTYITLLNWTDQGIRAYKNTTERTDAFVAALQKLGAR